MVKEQATEWAAVQNITVSINLVEAAKTHLKFLDAVEHRNHFLFEDHVLKRAVYRYNAFWLPLLAKHEENPISEESLVVPLDCELIWHCHRLNPVRYNLDCKKLFGRILTNRKVRSSLEAASKRTTEEIWSKKYPEEPYELDLENLFSIESLQKDSKTKKITNYDLIAAVKRQMGFTYQACRPHMSNVLFLKEAEARYKGFLHLVRANKKTSSKFACVPTYDVDLMWHTHQLYPDVYYKDMKELVGGLVQHNDSDPDKSKGSKLDIGFTQTTLEWEQSYGFSYWKAGAMSKGDIPTPVTRSPYKFNGEAKELKKVEKIGQQIHFPIVNSVEVLMEFVDIKNLLDERKENLVVAISKKQTDTLFKTKRCVGISSASKDKLFACFECEPRGEFLFELFSCSPISDELKPSRSFKRLGSCSLSFDELVASGKLWTNKWVSLDLVHGLGNSEPVLLNVSMSFSPPMPGPQVFYLGNCQRVQNDLIETRVMDGNGKRVLSLQKRSITKDETKCPSDLLTEVYYKTDSSEKETLVECHGNYWSVKAIDESFKLQKSSGDDDSLFELAGYNKIVKLFSGRRLQYRPKQFENEKSEQDFTTMVEFSIDYPYGRAVGLINSKSRTIRVMDESLTLPSIVLAFVLSNNHSEDEKIDFSIDEKETVRAAKGSMCCGLCAECNTDNANVKEPTYCWYYCFSNPDEAANVNAKGAPCNECAVCGFGGGDCDGVSVKVLMEAANANAKGAPCNECAVCTGGGGDCDGVSVKVLMEAANANAKGAPCNECAVCTGGGGDCDGVSIKVLMEAANANAKGSALCMFCFSEADEAANANAKGFALCMFCFSEADEAANANAKGSALCMFCFSEADEATNAKGAPCNECAVCTGGGGDCDGVTIET